MKKPKILIIDNSIDTTGAFKAIYHFAKYARNDFEFIFLLSNGSKLIKFVRKNGFEAEGLPFIEIGKSLKKILLYLPFLLINSWRLVKLTRKYEVDLVHVNDFYNLVGVTGKVLGGEYKLLTHVRFMPDRFPSVLVKLWYRLGLRYSYSLVCVSHAVKKCLSDHSKLKVIYDTIPAIDEGIVIDKTDRGDDQIRLLYLGHYIPGKGQDYALEAFSRAFQQDNRLRLKFVGGDMGLEKNQEFKQQLICRASRLGIEDYVEFAGPTTNTQKEYLQCDIALNFSESESFSFTCLEALALGIPLIATDCGGPAELFVHRKSGFLIPNHDIEKMSKMIVELAIDSILRNELSLLSKSYVESKFSIKNTYEELKKTYQEALTCC